MGTDIHITINGDPDLLINARDEIFRLEKLWSRFDDASEISQLNKSNGLPMKVSPETQQLIELGIQGWRETNGLFDPTVFGDVIRAGYVVSFDSFSKNKVQLHSSFQKGIETISLADGIVCMPRNIGFDPGGIGKGLAADLIAERIINLGAAGICVNIGGDIKVMGISGKYESWNIEIESGKEIVDKVSLADGAIATSTTQLRRWQNENGEIVHHIIDPRTGKCCNSPIVQISVIAAQGWQAEILAKAALIDGSMSLFDNLELHGAAAMAITMDGRRLVSPKWCHFTQEEFS